MLTWKNGVDSLSSFTHWNIIYYNCEANRVADGLAKISYPLLTTYTTYLPAPVHKMHLRDMQQASSYTASLRRSTTCQRDTIHCHVLLHSARDNNGASSSYAYYQVVLKELAFVLVFCR